MDSVVSVVPRRDDDAKGFIDSIVSVVPRRDEVAVLAGRGRAAAGEAAGEALAVLSRRPAPVAPAEEGRRVSSEARRSGETRAWRSLMCGTMASTMASRLRTCAAQRRRRTDGEGWYQGRV